MLMINRKSKAFTIIEIMLVLVIIAALLYAISRIYRMVDNSRRVNEAANQVLSVYQAAAQWYSSQSIDKNQRDYIPIFVDNGYLLESFKYDNADPWGGKITAAGQGPSIIRISLEKVPGVLCTNLVTKFKTMQNAKQAVSCPSGNTPGTFAMDFDLQVPSPTQ